MMMMMSKLFVSDDVVFEILSWLPPKSLLKFRSVSKSWYSTISHSDFIAKHQSHFGNYSLVQNKNNSCFLAIVVPHKKSLKLRQIPEQNDTLLSEDFSKDYYTHHKIMGCCNGVFCYASLIDNDDDAHILLCNPSIRWTRTVPPFPFYTNDEENNPQIYTYGVGFDRRNNDYKVIMISRGVADNLCVSRKAALYSVKFNSWKRVENVPGPPFSPNGVSIFLHGSIHWLSYTTSMYENKRIIMLFDVCNRVFGKMQLPAGNEVDDAIVRPYYKSNPATSHYSHGISISVVRGSLCFLVSSETCGDVNTVSCHMWIMKEYGVAESWTKQHVIEFKMDIERQLVSPFELIVHTQGSVGGKIMCSVEIHRYNGSSFKLALFDPETDECIDLGRSQHSCRDVVSLVPSLQLLDVIM